jgi:hypothetical protein
VQRDRDSQQTALHAMLGAEVIQVGEQVADPGQRQEVRVSE